MDGTGADAGSAVRREYERIFAMKAALTSQGQCGLRRSEVVLDQAILGLLIMRAAFLAVGN
jgi:hypothetical protein